MLVIDVLSRISNPCFNMNCEYALGTVSRSQEETKYVIDQFNSLWQMELRVRYIPHDLKELYENDRITFHYYFNQVNISYIILVIECTNWLLLFNEN